MSNRTRRKLEQAQSPAPQRAPLLVAVIRNSRSGHTAVIDSVNPDGSVREIFGTCSSASLPEAITKAYEAMMAEVGEAQSVRLIVEGKPPAP